MNLNLNSGSGTYSQGVSQVWFFKSRAFACSVSLGNAPRKTQERPGKWDPAGKELGKGAMCGIKQHPMEGGLPVGSVPLGALGSVSH